MLKKYKVKENVVKITRKIWPIIEKVLIIMIGSFLLAVAYNTLVVPYGLLSGGLSGIALIGDYLLNIPLPIGILILNIPVFILGLRELNISFMLYSLLGTLALAAALPLTKPYLPVPELDIFLAAIFSGVIGGFGGGIILRSGTSGGGADIIAIIAKKKWNISVGACSFYFNVIVILMSLYFFELKIALYTVISMWVSGWVIDKVLKGLSNYKSVTIISDENEKIAELIMKQLHRGVTLLDGHGGYTKESKMVISCVVNNYEIPRLKEIVLDLDPYAFMFISDTAEVSGRGFPVPK
jgi:uncharacterized membrane-anchored protein YitT (DUF2179 family)